MILFFDTETSGLPRSHRAPVTDLENWPRIVQIAWLLTDHGGDPKLAVEAIIRPDGYVIPDEASRIHGITTARAQREGRPLRQVLEQFLDDLSKADKVVAHNIGFDQMVLGSELLRCGLPNQLPTYPKVCTMVSSTEFCAIPGKYGPKWPKLEELHQRLFGTPVDGAHQALADVQATARCFFELQQRGLL